MPDLFPSSSSYLHHLNFGLNIPDYESCMAEIRGETDLSVNDNEKKGSWLGMHYEYVSVGATRTSINSGRLLKIEC